MEETVKQRLIKYLKYKNLGQTKFEEKAGLSRGYITNIKKEPTTSKLLKILSAAPDLNQQWLLTGEGEMLVQSVEATPLRRSEMQEYTTTKNGTRFYEREDGQIVMKIPIVPIAALGSPEDEFAELIADTDSDGDTVTMVVDGVHHGRYVAFRIEGDSMDDGTRDSFARKDIVAVRELARDKWLPKLHYGKWPFWVVVFGNNVRIKQIVDQDDTGNITFHSLNPSPEYTDFTLRIDEIRRLFNVVKHIPHPREF